MAAAAAENCNVLLMKFPPAWGVSSVSPGCIQVEAYLRLSGANFATADMHTTGPSPTGCLPAVETPDGIAGQSDDRYDDLAAASSVIEFLCTSRGLNSELPGHVCAESEAFTCLLDSHLSNAVRYSTWCEWSSLSQLPERFGKTLPWPLNYIIPYTQAMSVRRQFKGIDAHELYRKATNVIKALNNRAEASEGPYLLGKLPSVLDAKVYGILAYILAAPTVAPVLKDELQHSRALCSFLDHVAQAHFAMSAPSLLETSEGGAWSAAATGTTAKEAEAPKTAEELRAQRNSKWWMGGVGALIVGYVLLGGHYFGVEEIEVGDEDDEDVLE